MLHSHKLCKHSLLEFQNYIKLNHVVVWDFNLASNVLRRSASNSKFALDFPASHYSNNLCTLNRQMHILLPFFCLLYFSKHILEFAFEQLKFAVFLVFQQFAHSSSHLIFLHIWSFCTFFMLYALLHKLWYFTSLATKSILAILVSIFAAFSTESWASKVKHAANFSCCNRWTFKWNCREFSVAIQKVSIVFIWLIWQYSDQVVVDRFVKLFGGPSPLC